MKSLTAIYDGEVFRPTAGVVLAPGAKVEILVPEEPDYVAIVRARFPRSLGAISHEDAEEMMRVIEEECGRVDDRG